MRSEVLLKITDRAVSKQFRIIDTAADLQLVSKTLTDKTTLSTNWHRLSCGALHNRLLRERMKRMIQKNGVSAQYQSQHRRYVQSLTETVARMNDPERALNKNEAQTSGDSAIERFNARITELRYAQRAVILRAAKEAYDEDPVKAVKLFFHTGDIRGGKNEQHIFFTCMEFLTTFYPKLAKELLPLIPVYTRWENLIRLIGSNNLSISGESARLVAEQLRFDLDLLHANDPAETVDISALAKALFTFSSKTSANKTILSRLLNTLNMKESDYQQVLTELTEYTGAATSQSQQNMDPAKLPVPQLLRCTPYLKKELAQKRHLHIQAVLQQAKGKRNFIPNPLDICHDYEKGNWRGNFESNEDYESLWALLPTDINAGNTLVVYDGSGSMTKFIGKNTTITMREVATALTIYFAQRLSGPFKNSFLTFSTSPRLVRMAECRSLADCLLLMKDYNECGEMDPDATFELLLNKAKEARLNQNELPSNILILSDMDFDKARGAEFREENDTSFFSRDSLIDMINRKWIEAGYRLPRIIFWNLSGNRESIQETNSSGSVLFLNGFDMNDLSAVLFGEFDQLAKQTIQKNSGDESQIKETHAAKVILAPKDRLIAKLSSERYSVIAESVQYTLT